MCVYDWYPMVTMPVPSGRVQACSPLATVVVVSVCPFSFATQPPDGCSASISTRPAAPPGTETCAPTSCEQADPRPTALVPVSVVEPEHRYCSVIALPLASCMVTRPTGPLTCQ